ncbi:hypothetical protein RHMOL_Rhmol07G0072200 [Rhododendron molle]|uniref:Uncharacterized protein n=1 Tax=Rhododendron molle TaxID=49168 RepID=A0ACC0N038_RHOML|nr:hypothetical protein RHMOL_Rhmol07G0072200 [Rhododendron molle]
MFVPSQAPQSQQMNFAAPPVTPQTTVKPLVPGTPPVLRNVEQYPQLTLGSQLLNSGDISKNASEKLVQLCQSLDNGDFSTALQIQASSSKKHQSLFSFVSRWTMVILELLVKSRYNSPLATGMIKTRQSVR